SRSPSSVAAPSSRFWAAGELRLLAGALRCAARGGEGRRLSLRLVRTGPPAAQSPAPARRRSLPPCRAADGGAPGQPRRGRDLLPDDAERVLQPFIAVG